MDKVIYEKVPATRPKWKRAPTADGRGFTSVPDGMRSAVIMIEINVTQLVRHLGYKAMFNKTRKSRGLGGIIKVSAEQIVDKGEA